MSALDSQRDADIVTRLREWLNNKWPRDRSLDHDMLDAVSEIEESRDTISKLRGNISKCTCKCWERK